MVKFLRFNTSIPHGGGDAKAPRPRNPRCRPWRAAPPHKGVQPHRLPQTRPGSTIRRSILEDMAVIDQQTDAHRAADPSFDKASPARLATLAWPSDRVAAFHPLGDLFQLAARKHAAIGAQRPSALRARSICFDLISPSFSGCCRSSLFRPVMVRSAAFSRTYIGSGFPTFSPRASWVFRHRSFASAVLAPDSSHRHRRAGAGRCRTGCESAAPGAVASPPVELLGGVRHLPAASRSRAGPPCRAARSAFRQSSLPRRSQAVLAPTTSTGAPAAAAPTERCRRTAGCCARSRATAPRRAPPARASGPRGPGTLHQSPHGILTRKLPLRCWPVSSW